MSEPPKIFVSYSRKDRTWLERLQVHLKPLESEGIIDLWDDTEIKAGDEWEAEIEQALAEAKAAVLLISADFLASDFIRKRELQPLLETAKGEGLLILPVILSPCRFKRMKRLSAFQAVNNPDKPLISLARWEQESVFDRVAEAIENALAGDNRNQQEPAGVSERAPGPVRAAALVRKQAQSASSPAVLAPQVVLPQTWENALGMQFALIPAGHFEMGSEASEDEQPVHTVKISEPFYMGVHTVTQGQWKAVMGTEPWQGMDYVQEGVEYPAVYVSWEDAQAFIGKLDARDDESIYRLPTEAEWEYACRVGSTAAYGFGNDARKLKAYAWYEANAWDVGEQYAHRVGQKKPNAWGLYDMHGNVWEWVEDWSGPYTSEAVVDLADSKAGSSRVLRGGSFRCPARSARSAYRKYYPPGSRVNHLGFRLVRMAL